MGRGPGADGARRGAGHRAGGAAVGRARQHGRADGAGRQVYFQHVNAQGGIHGANIRVEVADDGYKVPDTVRLTRELLAKPEVVALYGFAGTASITQLLTDGVLAQGGAALVLPRAAVLGYVQPVDLPRARGLRRRGRAHGPAAHRCTWTAWP